MRKESKTTIRAKVIPARVNTSTVIYCDVDGVRIPKASYHYICAVCNRDICREHTCYDTRENDDYPSKLCPFCSKLTFDVYQEEYHDMIDRHWDEEKALTAKIRKESLEIPVKGI